MQENPVPLWQQHLHCGGLLQEGAGQEDGAAEVHEADEEAEPRVQDVAPLRQAHHQQGRVHLQRADRQRGAPDTSWR